MQPEYEKAFNYISMLDHVADKLKTFKSPWRSFSSVSGHMFSSHGLRRTCYYIQLMNKRQLSSPSAEKWSAMSKIYISKCVLACVRASVEISAQK